MSSFTSVPETVDRAAPDLRVLEHWKVYGVNAGLAGASGEVDYRLPTRGGHIPQTWRILARHLGAEEIVVGRQPHGRSVGVHRLPTTSRILSGFDGHVTDQPGLYLAVTVADCVPVYLFHPGVPAVAIVHAGWRGVAAGIVEAGIEALLQVTNGASADIVMHCGVSICGSCYEVGPEVWAALGEPEPETNTPIDLRKVIARAGRRLGVSNITVSPACTAHGSVGLQSYRRQGAKSGRMAAYIGIGEPCTRTVTPVD